MDKNKSRRVSVRESVGMTGSSELAETNSAAEEAARMKNMFLANVSHELRTPLNAIIGMAELLLAEDLTPRIHNYALDIRSSGFWLLDIINDILDFSSIESGKLALKPADYQPAAMLENIESMFVQTASQKAIGFKLLVKNELPECVFGDERRVRQVLVNIISNAIKFTTVGNVTLEAHKENGEMVFVVSDTGAGIKKEYISELYGAFEQIDETKTGPANGMGLGLTISHSLIEMMHGKITVESEYGKGSVFTVRLPYVPGNIEKITAAVQGFSFISAPAAEILVVDDSRVNLNVAVGMLKLCGINADTADDAFECYEKIRKKKYDIVFMDHILPGTDGVEATEYLRRNGYSDLVIIALTANTAIGARDLFKKCGMNDFLPKPIDKVQLNDMLRKWLPAEKLLETKNTAEDMLTPLNKERETMPVSARIIDSGKAILSLGDKELYYSILKTYYEETPEKIKGMTQALSDGDMNLFKILVHSVKSTSALIGALIPFRYAKEMEEASRGGETEYVTKNYPELLRLLNSTLEEVAVMISTDPDKAQTTRPSKLDKTLLANLYLACETMESLRIDEALSELRTSCKTQEEEVFVRKISELIDAFELSQVMELLID